MTYNGSGLVAMAGKNCVGIASDTRFGQQQLTIDTNMERIFRMSDKTLVGFSGLATDVLTVKQKLEMSCDMYKLEEHREIKPQVFDHLVSGFLYSKRFSPYFVEPLIAGLKEDGKPFLAGQDLLGAAVYAKDFVVCGSAEENLIGVCESFYKPDLGPDELFETLSQCLLAGVDRDCISGWGGVVHILTPTKHIVKRLKGRHD